MLLLNLPFQCRLLLNFGSLATARARGRKVFQLFTGQNPTGAKSSNGVPLGFSELFRKFYAAEMYSEVAKMFKGVYTYTLEGKNDSLEVLLPGRMLGTFP